MLHELVTGNVSKIENKHCAHTQCADASHDAASGRSELKAHVVHVCLYACGQAPPSPRRLLHVCAFAMWVGNQGSHGHLCPKSP